MNAIEKLEDWLHEKKGRYIKEIAHGNGYGAECWTIILGNTDIDPREDWYKEVEENNKAEIFCNEVSFFDIEDLKLPPNIVYASDDDFCGLEKTILAALNKAKELGV